MNTWIPAGRLLTVIERSDFNSAELTRADRRFISDLRNGRQKFVSLRRADNLLTKLHMGDWWHLPKEHGGLADIYEDGAHYGSPNYSSRHLVPAPKKYATAAERHQARLETYRRYYRRSRGLEEAA